MSQQPRRCGKRVWSIGSWDILSIWYNLFILFSLVFFLIYMSIYQVGNRPSRKQRPRRVLEKGLEHQELEYILFDRFYQFHFLVFLLISMYTFPVEGQRENRGQSGTGEGCEAAWEEWLFIWMCDETPKRVIQSKQIFKQISNIYHFIHCSMNGSLLLFTFTLPFAFLFLYIPQKPSGHINAEARNSPPAPKHPITTF